MQSSETLSNKLARHIVQELAGMPVLQPGCVETVYFSKGIKVK